MKLRDKILAYLIFFAVNAYGKTWRYRLINRDKYDKLRSEGKKVVLALWHDQLLPCTFLHRHDGFVTIASDSKDGGLITFALDKWGFHTARGSSTRGGVKAAISAIKLTREFNTACAVTVDGPKGPRHTVKDGAVFIAKKLDKVIVIGLIHSKSVKRFASWDRFILPLPFARIDVTYSDPIFLSDADDEAGVKADTQILQNKMTELTIEASPLFI